MLNNRLQKEGKRNDLNYEYTSSGPNHAIIWTAFVYCKSVPVGFYSHIPKVHLLYFLVANEEIGQGTGVTKGDAGEAAAQAAYERLSPA